MGFKFEPNNAFVMKGEIMNKSNQRLYFFINGFLQIIDGFTFMIMSIFNKPGTQFSYKHFVNKIYEKIKDIETK
jgi:hypothetical protein